MVRTQRYDAASAAAPPFPRLALAAALLLLTALPLVAQETGETGDSATAAEIEADAGDRAETAAGDEAAETPDTVDVAPHPHDGFDFPSSEIEAAAEVGLAWLELIDAGEYEEGWAIGASTLQNSGSPQSLEATINAGRRAYRPLGARTLVGFQQMNNPPNAPPGDYVMLQYRTEVSGDRTIIETVVPRQDGDAWRVAAYFIQRE